MQESVKSGAWHDPTVWGGGQVPTASDCVVIRHEVTLSGAAYAARVEVDGTVAGAELAFAPGVSSSLECSGNVVVRGYADSLQEKIGRLRMQPDSRGVEHTLRFVGVDEGGFVGGGMQVLESDVGLWVDGPGAEVILEGTPVGDAWNRVGTHPDWLPSDELIATPVAAGAYSYTPVVAPVPSLTWRGETYFGEVVNLTRNVRIEGTPAGYAHVHLNQVTRASRVSDVAIRYMGLADNGATPIGRYGFHVHHGDAAGISLERVVVRDCKGRAFVIHGTRGPTRLSECVAVDCKVGFWWDAEPGPETYPANASHGVTYDRCGVVGYSSARGAFELGQGTGNQCVKCFAACGSHVLGAGFFWPGEANFLPNVWGFEGCRAHNTKGRGLAVWQNDENGHMIRGFTAFQCDGPGIRDGAYGNVYSFARNHVFLCGAKAGVHSEGALGQHAASRIPTVNAVALRKEIADNVLDGGGAAPALYVARTAGKPDRAVTVRGNHLRGVVRIHESQNPPGTNPGEPRSFWYLHNVVGDAARDLEPEDFEVVFMVADSVHIAERRDGTCFQLHPDGTSSALPDFTISGQV